jgi:hypothetical protein
MCRLCQFATRCPASALGARPRAFFAGPGNRSCWRALPVRFSDAKRFAERLARRGPFAGDVDFVLDREWRFRGRGHVTRLARDTHLAVLSERDERTAGAHPAFGPCVRANFADRCPVAGHAPWAPLRPAFRYPYCQWATRDLTDRWLACPLDTVSGGICTCLGSAALMGFRLPFAGLIPPLQGNECFHSLQTPRARLPPPFVSRPFSSGGRRCQLRSLLDATVAGWGGCASGIRLRS